MIDSYLYTGVNGQFLSEFSDFLPSIIAFEIILLLGDFNVPVNDAANSFVDNFVDLIKSFGLTQHIKCTTHVKHNTLDLVFTLHLNIDCIRSEEMLVTDHSCLLVCYL